MSKSVKPPSLFDICVNVIAHNFRYCVCMESDAESQTQQDVIEHTKALLSKIQNKTVPDYLQVRDHVICVFPGVFEPTTETHLLAAHLHPKSGDRVLDLTTGSGVLGVIAGSHEGVSGIAVDINPIAVENAAHNFLWHNVNMVAIHSNLFTNIPNEKFDLITCNPPYYEGEPQNDLEYATFGGRDFLRQLFFGLSSVLKDSGAMLITDAQWAGNAAFLESLAQEYGYTSQIIGEKKSKDERRVYRLYRITKPIST